MKSKRAALLLRVSTEEQNLDNQRIQLEQVAAARGLEVVTVYEEKVSGAKADRPTLRRMMADAHAGLWSTLLVVAIDRLGRSMMNTISTILDLDQKGIAVVSPARAPFFAA